METREDSRNRDMVADEGRSGEIRSLIDAFREATRGKSEARIEEESGGRIRAGSAYRWRRDYPTRLETDNQLAIREYLASYGHSVPESRAVISREYVAALIDRILEATGFSQVRLAYEMGLSGSSQADISKWKNKKADIPPARFESLLQVAREHQIPLPDPAEAGLPESYGHRHVSGSDYLNNEPDVNAQQLPITAAIARIEAMDIPDAQKLLRIDTLAAAYRAEAMLEDARARTEAERAAKARARAILAAERGALRRSAALRRAEEAADRERAARLREEAPRAAPGPSKSQPGKAAG